jgi:hypothetical protein
MNAAARHADRDPGHRAIAGRHYTRDDAFPGIRGALDWLGKRNRPPEGVAVTED